MDINKEDIKKEIVKFQKVYFSYSDFIVLEDINLTIYQNDLLALIGPNGGGKTTLLKLMMGLLKPSTGSIKLFNESPYKKRNLIGYLPQTRFMDTSFPINVFDTVLIGRYRGVGKKYMRDDFDAVENSLKITGILALKERHISMLSGGQLQRVLIARAIVGNPKLLLLDEPLSGVDAEMQASFYELILELNKRMAVLFVTHDIGAISSYFDSVACLNRKLYYHGPKEGSLGKLEDTYGCPIEIIAHGIPHRVLKEH